MVAEIIVTHGYFVDGLTNLYDPKAFAHAGYCAVTSIKITKESDEAKVECLLKSSDGHLEGSAKTEEAQQGQEQSWLSMLAKACRIMCIILIGVALLIRFYAPYTVLTDGTLHLKHARGRATIRREDNTMIPHIEGESLESVIYAQGFAHAQTRLWSIEKARRLAAGEISELFGSDVLPIDVFMRSLRMKSVAEEI